MSFLVINHSISKMARYNINHIRTRRSYSPTDVSDLFSISRKTVSRWVKEGLTPIRPNSRPLLITGQVLKDFILGKRSSKKVDLRDNEYYCLSCRKAKRPKSRTEVLVKTGKRIGKSNREQYRKIAQCCSCGTKVSKFI